jgi:hypothetical protein
LEVEAPISGIQKSKKGVFMKILKIMAVFLVISFAGSTARADVNVNLLSVNSPDSQKLEQTYARTYGFPTTQIAPVMMAPATEVPTILQIAKAATVAPLAVWGLRKMGYSYMDILRVHSLPPTILFAPDVPYERYGAPLGQAYVYQQQYGPSWPTTVVLADPVITQLAQIRFFTVGLKIPTISLLTLPADPIVFNRVVLNPWGNPTYFIPPGQAKKMGLWLPPGQAKKYWKHDDWDDDHHHHGDWDDDDHHHHGKWKEDDHHHEKEHGKWEAKEGGDGHKGKGKFKW